MNYEPEDYSIFIHRYKGAYVATVLEFGAGINVVEGTREAALREILELTKVVMELDPHIAPYTSLIYEAAGQDNTYRFEHDPDTYTPHSVA